MNFTISTAKPVRFPLFLRIPGWCDAPKMAVNGKAVASAKGWTTVDRTWKKGDRIRLEFPMRVTFDSLDQESRHRLDQSRSPDLLAEDRRALGASRRDRPVARLENIPTTPWNYGLILSSVQFRDVVTGGATFRGRSAPVTLRAKGKRIPVWKQG